MVDKHSKPNTLTIFTILLLIACNAQAFTFADITKQLPDKANLGIGELTKQNYIIVGSTILLCAGLVAYFYNKLLGATLIIPAITILITLILLKMA